MLLKNAKKPLVFILLACMTLQMLTACQAKSTGEDEPAQVPAAGESAEAGESPEAAEAGSSDLPMDPSVMKPRINSEVIGMVTEDTAADVKDDFYLAVNRDWILNAKLRPGYTSETEMVHGTMAEVQRRCIGLLEDKTLTGWDAEIIQTYYELWLDWDARNEAGLTPFMPVFEKLDAVQTLDEMTEFFLSDENFCWGAFPAAFRVRAASSDTSRHEVSIYPAELTLSDTTDYEESVEALYENGTPFGDVCTYMLGRLGREGEAERVIKNAYSFEAKLAAGEYSYEEDNQPETVRAKINPVTMDDLRAMSPAFPLGAFMEHYGWAESELINLEQPKWLAVLNETYTEENLPLIRDWTLAKILENVISSSDEEAFRKKQEIDCLYNGLREAEPDRQLAFNECSENFPDEFARVYIEKYITEEDRTEIEGICREVIENYREMLAETEWLSEEMREMAVRKLDGMKIWPLYPDAWTDESALHITPKAEGGSYARACGEFERGVQQIYLAEINRPVDPDIWSVTVLESNASYHQNENAFCIQAGFLGDAVWRGDMSIEEKYGKLGCVIGHEISHAFDTNGAQHDENGNISDWWTEEDYRVFEERARKLADWFSGVAAFDDGTPYPGSVVQAEAIADMAGMKCILRMAKKIEGFDYDKFFRANAAMWARIDTLDKARRMLKSDPHPFNYLRVNAVVQQFDEFLETYGVKEGDGMYLAPEERIAVW
ncbi:MAG: M13 family metallopeptidase [Lachnospiraceae bacterium]|nr:M13 family metallopeptidase [Lachnospiraceae bacterium]